MRLSFYEIWWSKPLYLMETLENYHAIWGIRSFTTVAIMQHRSTLGNVVRQIFNVVVPVYENPCTSHDCVILKSYVFSL